MPKMMCMFIVVEESIFVKQLLIWTKQVAEGRCASHVTEIMWPELRGWPEFFQTSPAVEVIKSTDEPIRCTQAARMNPPLTRQHCHSTLTLWPLATAASKSFYGNTLSWLRQRVLMIILAETLCPHCLRWTEDRLCALYVYEHYCTEKLLPFYKWSESIFCTG